MIRTQVQLPDALHREAKRIAEEHEISLAEVVRRGIEHMIRIYPTRRGDGADWTPPSPRHLGPFCADPETWRERANVHPGEGGEP